MKTFYEFWNKWNPCSYPHADDNDDIGATKDEMQKDFMDIITHAVQTAIMEADKERKIFTK